MAIDTANKRRNVLNIATPFLFLGLLPVAGVDTDDRENLSEVYIGYTYSAPVASADVLLSRVTVHSFALVC
jgi:hypothetical protein